MILEIISKAGLKAKPEKCQLLEKEVTFLGHLVSDKGIQQNRYGIDLEMIWLEKINKIKCCMEVWKLRDLTYFGKKIIIKSFVLSVIGYEIEMRCIPVKFAKEINSIISDFIWDGKTKQISRNVCSLPQNKGGWEW